MSASNANPVQKLSNQRDVLISTPTDGQTLIYVAASSTWINDDAAGGLPDGYEKDVAGGIAGLDETGKLAASVFPTDWQIHLRGGTADENYAATLDNREVFVADDTRRLCVPDGVNQGGWMVSDVASRSCIVVRSVDQGSDTVFTSSYADIALANGQALLDAYAFAKALVLAGISVNGNTISTTNRLTVLVAPGLYRLEQMLVLDTTFIDLVGVSSNAADTIIERIDWVAAESIVKQTVQDACVSNLTLQASADSFVEPEEGWDGGTNDANTPCFIWVTTAGATTKWTNIRLKHIGVSSTMPGTKYGSSSGGNWTGIDAPGVDCCFGNNAGCGGTFTGCITGTSSFGYDQEGSGSTLGVSGVFKQCRAGESSFGASIGRVINVTGIFEDCVAGTASFGGALGAAPLGSVTGRFYRCKAGNNSFGSGRATVSASFYDCIGGIGSFGGRYFSGTWDESGVQGVMSGLMERCSFWAVTNLGYPTGAEGVLGWGAKVSGIVRDCRLKVTQANFDACTIENTASFYMTTIITAGTGKPMSAATAKNARVAHCRFNVDPFGANVTNIIDSTGNGYNVIDSDIA